MPKKKSFWWYVKEGGVFALNSALVFLPEILALSPEYTVAGKAAGVVSQAWRVMGMRKQYMKVSIPMAMEKFFDKLPDKVTGVKGSKLPSGLSDKNP